MSDAGVVDFRASAGLKVCFETEAVQCSVLWRGSLVVGWWAAWGSALLSYGPTERLQRA